jgi:hypothetical protein
MSLDITPSSAVSFSMTEFDQPFGTLDVECRSLQVPIWPFGLHVNLSSAILRRFSNAVIPDCTVFETILSVIALTDVAPFATDPVSGDVASIGE